MLHSSLSKYRELDDILALHDVIGDVEVGAVNRESCVYDFVEWKLTFPPREHHGSL